MKKTITALCALSFVVAFDVTASAQTANLNPVGIDQEHYQCYTVKGDRKTLPIKSLADQFGTTKDLKIVGPTYLCAPVSKNGDLLADKVTHLVCYTVQDTKPLSPSPLVSVTNQLGTFRFNVVQSKLLCVPSTKKVIN